MEEPPKQEPRSLRQRGRDAARRATQPLTSATEAVTGATVERQVAEYSETFTQVVLGLHEDLASASRRIGQLEGNASALEDRVTSAESAIQSQRYCRPLAIAALALGLVAIGVALWVAL